MSCKCQKCGKQYKVDIIIVDSLWNKIKPKGKIDGGGMLCGSCIMDKIELFNKYDCFFLINKNKYIINKLNELLNL